MYNYVVTAEKGRIGLEKLEKEAPKKTLTEIIIRRIMRTLLFHVLRFIDSLKATN